MADIVEKQRQKLLNKKKILQNAKLEKERVAKLDEALDVAKAGSVSGLKTLLDDGLPVNTVDKYGGTIMHWAAGTGQLAVCQLLYSRGGDPYIKLTKGGGRGRTALHYAARNGHLAICRWLIDNVGMPPNIATHDHTTPLQLAVWKGHLDVCSWLVHGKGVDVEQVNGYGCDGSHWAALGGCVASAKWLQGEGVSLTEPNLVGHTALHKAALGGHRPLCEWLLHHEPAARRCLVATDGEGKVPAALAADSGFAELAAWLRREEEEERSALPLAVGGSAGAEGVRRLLLRRAAGALLWRLVWVAVALLVYSRARRWRRETPAGQEAKARHRTWGAGTGFKFEWAGAVGPLLHWHWQAWWAVLVQRLRAARQWYLRLRTAPSPL